MCEANVVLNQTVEIGMTYELSLAVRDTSGEVTTVSCTIQVTNGTSPLSDVFQHLNQYITVPEVSEIICCKQYQFARLYLISS
jgi:hypothetical protein